MASFEKKGEQDAQPSTRTARDGDSTQESLTYRVARRVPGILRYVVAVALVSWVVWEYTRGWRDGEWVVGPAPSEWLVEPNNNIWNEITPSTALDFHDCYDGMQCARLDVPMDWNGAEDNSQRVQIALMKRPAAVPITDSRYGGPVLLNPGGPGGSGIEILERHNKAIQMIVDAELDPSKTEFEPLRAASKYFDIMSFDPRGVNNTTPHFSCFPDPLSRSLWYMQSGAEGMLGSSEDSFMNVWTRTKAVSEGCSKRSEENKDSEPGLAYHINTTPVVADMVEIIERHGEWREKEAKRLLAQKQGAANGEHSDAILERTRWRKGEEKLQYWGFSYGTVLGATFAAMHPGRVERAVIDGVVDTPDYYRGEWLTNLQDTDIMLDKFAEYCFEAGLERCPLYSSKGAKKIKADFENIIMSLKGNPIGVPAEGTKGPDLITYTDAKWAVRTALYGPLKYVENLFQMLADASRGNGTSFSIHKQRFEVPIPSPQCRDAEPYSQECMEYAGVLAETTVAVVCGDGESIYGMKPEVFKAYWKTLASQSSLIGDSWAHIRMTCAGWRVRPKWRFTGPFEGKTAKPMLVVGPTTDCVTPLKNAHAMAKRYPGSAVLGVDAEGHCTLSSPSICTAKTIRRYFQSGELPKTGTVCEDNEKPFIGLTKEVSDDDKELLEALRWTAKHWV